MTDTDAFKFNRLKIFESIKDNLPDGVQEICDVYEDLIFVWNFKDNNLLVTNWRASQTEIGAGSKFQILVPSSTPNFTISKVSVSFRGTFLSISGLHGVSLIELPLRWGSDGMYQNGKSQITCQTFHLHEHLANRLEVVQTRWHPDSPTDSHLLILLSDNSIRMYEESSLKHVWRVGPVPNYAAVEQKLSYLKSLGDTAVDFDVAPAKLVEDYNPHINNTTESNIDTINNSFQSLLTIGKRNQTEPQKKVEWPIVILRGNGTIFVLNAALNTEKPRLQGPLTMIPSCKDNYGDNSCSLLVIPTLPLTIVIAENSGVLHHALMIDSTSEESSFDESKTLLKNDWDLFVLETIELELGLSEEKIIDAPKSPVIIKRDPINEQRYYCYHETGLHGVTIGFVPQLQSYVEEEDTELEPNMNVKSRAEYILSTKAFNSSKVNSVIGVGLLQSPSGIFAIMKSGQVVSLQTLKLALSVIPELPLSATSTNDFKPVSNQKIPFDQHIKALLSSGISQPIIKLDKTKPPTSQQAFELLMNTAQVMRDNQFKRHDQVRQEISKRVKILELKKNQQRSEIDQLFEDKEMIQEKAYMLADAHEDIMERQHNLQRRVQDVLRLASLRLPSENSSEKEFIEQIKKIKAKTDKLLQDMKQIKAKQEIQREKLETYEAANENSIKALPPKQEESIKEILGEMTKQISSLTKDVQKISAIVDA